MYVRRSTRVVCVAVLLTPAVVAGTLSSKAQSLSEALAGPARNAVEIGSWSTVTAVDPPKTDAVFDHWQAKITLTKPRLKQPSLLASNAEPPYGLHGPVVESGLSHAMKGLASFYGSGARTATGEAFNPNELTAAHRTLPFGTRVRVTRVDNGDSVIVRINDRGPFKPGRVIDLSTRAAKDLEMTDKGLAAVKLEVLDQAAAEPPAHIETVAQRSLRR